MIACMQAQLQIIPIPAFKDNYIWLMHNRHEAVIVDPGDAVPVLEVLQAMRLKLTTILITHHHHDHIGGVEKLLNTYPDAEIYAPRHEQFVFKHIAISEPDVINIDALNITFKVLDVPGHTLGHIAYFNVENEHPILFCGDTLFGAGCGRLFEGTPQQMFDSLQKLKSLPADTQVYCTHEYTLHNISFAMTLEPGNSKLMLRQSQTLHMRNLDQPSLPSTLALELETNPFLRCDTPEIQAAVGLENGNVLKVFTAVRERRNHY